MVSTAVLFASADAHRRRERSSRSPRPLSSGLALLPVGNKPLVLHALEELVDAGVTNVAVVSVPSVADEVRDVVDASGPSGAAITHVVQEDGTFIDTLKRVGDVVGREPFAVHLCDSLTHGGLEAAISASPPADNDAVALVQENGSGEVIRLTSGLAGLQAAGIYVFGPGVLDLPADGDAPDDWDLEIASATQRLASAGGKLEVRAVSDWWRYRQHSGALLQANRYFLAGIRGAATDAWLENTDLQGPVIVHASARLISTTVRGPAIIGPEAELRDAYVGPYTSIGARVLIENAEVEHSIILPGASIRHLGGRLEASVVGVQAKIFRDFRLPRALRVNVGEGAEIAIT
jgi:glucose-1-phosphate thymidylyltransferase